MRLHKTMWDVERVDMANLPCHYQVGHKPTYDWLGLSPSGKHRIIGKLADGGAGMGKDKKKTVPEKREGKKMATQLAPTPTLYGKDAEEVWKQIQKKPTEEQLLKARARSEFFKQIKKKGLE